MGLRTAVVVGNPKPASRTLVAASFGRSSRSMRSSVIPDETRATTSPPSNTGTTARTERPRVPVYSCTNTSPPAARPRSPMNGSPIRSGSGWE